MLEQNFEHYTVDSAWDLSSFLCKNLAQITWSFQKYSAVTKSAQALEHVVVWKAFSKFTESENLSRTSLLEVMLKWQKKKRLTHIEISILIIP